MIDETDREILRRLQQNARMPSAEIARQVGMAPSAVFQRLRRLEERGVTQGYAARVDPRALGYGLVAFVMVQSRDSMSESDAGAALARLPEAQEVHRVVGEDCYIVKLRVRDTDALAHLLEHRIQTIPSIASTRTTIVVKTVKETFDIPLDEGQQPLERIP